MAEIILLGSYHFMEEMKIDIFSKLTQNEIENLVKKMLDYCPTKVFIEAPMNEQHSIEKAYNRIEKVDFTDIVSMRNRQLGEIKIKGKNYPIHMNNEAIQIGFRLAKYMNHEKVYAVDDTDFFEYEAQLLAQYKIEYPSEYDFNVKCRNELEKKVNADSFMKKMKYLNSKEWSERMHKYYYEDIKQVGKNTNCLGKEKILKWEVRNERIVSNIRRYIDENDRVVIIYGAGHLKPFMTLLSPDYVCKNLFSKLPQD